MGKSAGLFPRFLNNADQLGLPTRFLRDIQSSWSYSIKDADEKGTQSTDVYFNDLYLKPSALAALTPTSFTDPPRVGSGVGSIYHEGTHAWIDLKDGEATVKDMMKKNKANYVNSRLEDGSIVTDPERVGIEAIATYVGVRIDTWFDTMCVLSRMKAETSSPSEILLKNNTKRAKDCKKNYNDMMSKRIYGYQDVRDKGWIPRKHQVETTQAIATVVKVFADTTLLEGKLLEAFDQDTRLSRLWNDLKKIYPDIDTP